MEVLEKVIVPIVVAILSGIFGFFGGCKFEQYKNNQKINGDNNGNIAGRDIKNVYNKKYSKNRKR
jgi:hypothetical protein